jgi:carbonic anhydrase/acetyltransferase-like protein (isoleucine patch superfamily)
MPAYQLDQFLPDIDPSCWIAPCATIIGNVVVGSGSSIWFGSVVRGDNEPIVYW